jgi:hypothetical protein
VVRVTSNTAHKNRLTYLSSDFSHHYALNKGESWINWVLKLVLLIENQLILVRPNTLVLGLRDGHMVNALHPKYNTRFYLLSNVIGIESLRNSHKFFPLSPAYSLG